MSLEGDGSLYFQPTVVGSSTNRHYLIRNLSHLPLRLVSMVSVSKVFIDPLWINVACVRLSDCSFMTDSSGAFQSQTRSLSLLNQMMVNSIPTTAQ